MQHPSTPHSANWLLLLILPICMVALLFIGEGFRYLVRCRRETASFGRAIERASNRSLSNLLAFQFGVLCRKK